MGRLDAVAFQSEALQIKALSAPIWEATWVGLLALGDGLLGDIQPKPVAAGGGAGGGPGHQGRFAALLPAATMAAEVLKNYKQADLAAGGGAIQTPALSISHGRAEYWSDIGDMSLDPVPR